MKTIYAVLFTGLLTIPSLFSAAQQPPEGELAVLYESIIADCAKGHPPRLEAVAGHFDNVVGMDVRDIQSALPWIQKAIESPSVEARTYGLTGLYAIDERQDSASLIGYLVPVIAKNLDDPTTWAMGYMALSNMKPKPPEAAISLLLQALQSSEKLRANKELGPGIVFELMDIDPNRDDFVTAIDAYMNSEMKTTDQKVGTLNALAANQVPNKRLIVDIAPHLTDQSEDVRISAIRAIERSGPTGVAATKPQLQRLAGSGETSDRVRAAAKRALSIP